MQLARRRDHGAAEARIENEQKRVEVKVAVQRQLMRQQGRDLEVGAVSIPVGHHPAPSHHHPMPPKDTPPHPTPPPLTPRRYFTPPQLSHVAVPFPITGFLLPQGGPSAAQASPDPHGDQVNQAPEV